MAREIKPRMPYLAAFGVSVTLPGGLLDLDRLAVRPETALKLNPRKFLEFADAVCAVARKYREATAQSEMNLEGG